MYAFAPDGTPITGTLECLDAEAYITPGSFVRFADGTLGYDHAGDTEIWWGNQTTATRKGKVVYLDENNSEWTEDELVLSEDGNWCPAEAPEASAPTDPVSALHRIASRLRGEWQGPAGDLAADVAEVVRSVPGLADAFHATPEI